MFLLHRGFAQKVRKQSREAGRLTVAQHFSAGIRTFTSNESAKRTTEILQQFSRPFHGLETFGALLPALKCWAIISRRLRRLNGRCQSSASLTYYAKPCTVATRPLFYILLKNGFASIAVADDLRQNLVTELGAVATRC
jgi:hypothetical protein